MYIYGNINSCIRKGTPTYVQPHAGGFSGEVGRGTALRARTGAGKGDAPHRQDKSGARTVRTRSGSGATTS